MKVEDINSNDDIVLYIEGCLNDFELGITDKKETISAFIDLIEVLITKK